MNGKSRRALERMGRVRPELMRVVYSHLTDAEAATRVGDVVRSDPEAAQATFQFVRKAVRFSREYDTDRAYRILVAAMRSVPPEPVLPENVELFERERELGWLPLSEAFERLRSAVPELSEIGERAEELAAAPDEFGIVHDTEHNMPTLPSGVLPESDGLVGPDSRHPDPLVRSYLAASVVVRYVVAVLTHDTDRATWARGQAGLHIFGSFF